ncbi:ECF RNA polymerase sigma factor SigH [Planctomycetes bacterium Pan216]|uniref:RNA polymerase sigma factor n=1 Tax=Kolteria novifilia TaxID=2527975 RepID=A0A518B8X9_9BACT|nr:ECF RNA polymerase sigma factor SigH [Planctomycetes bacterium Pan216]
MAASKKAGSPTAELEDVFTEHAPALRRFITGVLRDGSVAEDIVQAAFVKAISSVDLAELDSVRAWLFRVAYHEALAWRRKNKTRERHHEQLLHHVSHQESETPEENFLRAERVVQVRDALDRLPEEQRRVVHARLYEGKTFAEIAEADQLPLGTVLTRMRLAMNKLREMLQDNN